jgi:hypothetical protein
MGSIGACRWARGWGDIRLPAALRSGGVSGYRCQIGGEKVVHFGWEADRRPREVRLRSTQPPVQTGELAAADEAPGAEE